MSIKIKVWNLVSDTDYGTNTTTYVTRVEAAEAFIETINDWADGGSAVTYSGAQDLYQDLIDNQGCVDSIGIHEQTLEFAVSPPWYKGLKRFYVTMTWDNFPEGGSYGAVVWATDHGDAEQQIRLEMVDSREDLDEPHPDWEVVDCFELDEFIERRIHSNL